MNVLVFVPQKKDVSACSRLIPALRRLGHEVLVWEFQLQWCQESSFPEKSLDVKILWTRRLSDIIARKNIRHTVGELDYAVNSFQIVDAGAGPASELSRIPAVHHQYWTVSPFCWRKARAVPLFENGVLKSSNLVHRAADPVTDWELRALLGIAPENACLMPRACGGDFSGRSGPRNKDVVFVCDAELSPEAAAACHAGGNFFQAFNRTVFAVRQRLDAFGRTLVPSVVPLFSELSARYLRELKTRPLATSLPVLLMQNAEELRPLVFAFAAAPMKYAELLAADDLIRRWLYPFLAKTLDEKFNTAVYAPMSWGELGFRDFRGPVLPENLGRAYAEGTAGVCFSRRAAAAPFNLQVLDIMEQSAVCLCNDSPENFAGFERGKHLDAFADFEEAVSKTATYINSKEERARILLQSRERLSADHTWEARVQELLKQT